jgi:SAM-dependent methyltransferase
VTVPDYRQIRHDLQAAYDADAERRDAMVKQPWKLAERAAFAAACAAGGFTRLLEIGAGTGQDSEYFAGQGLTVTATDASAAMVARCRAKGLDARQLDFSGLDFPAASFDAVHAMNCLLHVPDAELPGVLAGIARVLRPGGLFFLGVYGGRAQEGVMPGDDHVPARFFSFRTGEQLQRYASQRFDIVDFHVVPLADGEEFQSLTLCRPE